MLAATFACLVLLFAAPLAARAQSAASFELLDLGPGVQGLPHAASADGSVLVGTYFSPPDFDPRGFRWEAGIFRDLGVLFTPEVFPLAVSGDGSKIVGWARGISGDLRPFVWTAADGMQELPNIPGSEAAANGISRDGNVIAGHFLILNFGGPFLPGFHAFRWSGGVMTDLGFLPGFPGAKALAVCGFGAAVVGKTESTEAWRWRPNVGMEDLGAGYAFDCSDDGSVVVGESIAQDTLAARWDPAGLSTLGALGGVSSNARGVSADGAVVVGEAGLPFVLGISQSTAFRWTAGTMSQLSRVLASLGVTTPLCHALPCAAGTWYLRAATAISPDGNVIVGFAEDASGNTQGYRAVVPRGNAVCTPTTCAAQGKNCGTMSDGCGGTLTCGVCTVPQTCGGGGIANVCDLATVSSVTLNPIRVVGGNPSTGTVTLTVPAPAGGSVATLASGGAAASVPASVTVAAGTVSASFPVTTSAVSASTVTPISASLFGSTKTALMTVNPACIPLTPFTGCAARGLNCGTITDGCGGTLTCGVCTGPQTCGGGGVGNVCGLLTVSSLALTPTSVVSGSPSTGTVFLNVAAPAGGAAVTLSSTSIAATTPATVTVPAGANGANFTVTTSAVASATTVTITASFAGLSRTAALTLNPPPPITSAPTLLSPADQASVAQPVLFDWTDVANAVAYEIQIATSGNFTPPLTLSQNVTISQATITGLPAQRLFWRVRGINAAGVAGPFSASRRVTPQAAPPPPAVASLSAVSVNPASVVGGNGATGTVTLTSAAPGGGLLVNLASSNAVVATVPATVTVAAGATSASFAVTTSAVASSTAVTITGTGGGVTRTATLTVNPVVACTPTTCAAQGKNCGTITDGCGGTLTCGVCTAPQTCGGGGVANVCGLTTASTALLTLTATGRAGESVSSSPVGLTVNVGTTGSSSFTTGTSVTLTVSNGRVAIWSGGCSSGGAKVKTCTFTINAATSVTATVQ